jgi:hypothetical protein
VVIRLEVLVLKVVRNFLVFVDRSESWLVRLERVERWVRSE